MKLKSLSHWDKRYLQIAKQISLWSKDPSTQVGAIVIGKHGQVLAQGYNGFPRKINDTIERLKNREEKYKYTIHAEMNCIYNASLSGISLENGSLYVYGLPICSECAKGIIQVGIIKVIALFPQKNVSDKWKASSNLSMEMFDEAGIQYYFEEENQ